MLCSLHRVGDTHIGADTSSVDDNRSAQKRNLDQQYATSAWTLVNAIGLRHATILVRAIQGQVSTPANIQLERQTSQNITNMHTHTHTRALAAALLQYVG